MERLKGKAAADKARADAAKLPDGDVMKQFLLDVAAAEDEWEAFTNSSLGNSFMGGLTAAVETEDY